MYYFNYMNIIMSHALQQQYHHHRSPPTKNQSKGTDHDFHHNSKRNSSFRSPFTPTSPLDFTDRIPFNELVLYSDKTLGSGSFGTVFKGRWRGRNVAVKQFKTKEEIDSFSVEVKQLSCVKHPNIVTLYGASTIIEAAFLIMEYAEDGSLNHLLHECKHIDYDLRHACSWALQTARGVEYLHGIRPKPIMHRDLKPANLLLFNRCSVLKICDFGTACTVKTHMTNNTGSASYMAPEVFSTSSYLESGDVFSWSIIFWEILARKQPYTSQEYSNVYRILWSVNNGLRPSMFEGCNNVIWDLISKSWNKDPKLRPTMSDVAREMELIYSLTHIPTTSSSTAPVTTARNISENVANSLHNRQHHNSKQSQQHHHHQSHHRNNSIQEPRITDRIPRGSVSINIDRTTTSSREVKTIKRRNRLLVNREMQLKMCDKNCKEDLLNEYQLLKKTIKLRSEHLKQTISIRSTFNKSSGNCDQR